MKSYFSLNDLGAGAALTLVSVPLCLSIATASGAPAYAGIVSGVVGGLLVGSLGRAPLVVVGPAAGLSALVAQSIASLGSYESFLAALLLAGLLQAGFGFLRGGFLSGFLPSGVTRGLLAAIGLIVMLKQIPHIAGDDWDYIGDLMYWQADGKNTFTEIWAALGDMHAGPAFIGASSLLLIGVWSRVPWLKRLPLPPTLVVLLLSPALAWLVAHLGGDWAIGPEHRVALPAGGLFTGWARPDLSALTNPAVLRCAATLAAAASLESFVGYEAASRVDPQGRAVPISRELAATGVGNAVCGLLGGLPVCSLIVRTGVSADAGSTSKAATIVNGALLALAAGLAPAALGRLPLAAVAAVLFVAGLHLFQRAGVGDIAGQNRSQALTFAATIAGVVVGTPLTGILAGLAVGAVFIVVSMMRRPFTLLVEKHVSGEIRRIQLADQITFLNRASLADAFQSLERGAQVVIDARQSDYIDPDVLDMIREFESRGGPAKGVTVSLVGFKAEYRIGDRIRYLEVSTKEVQAALTPAKALSLLQEGNVRFRRGERLNRDLVRQVDAVSSGQFPIAAIVSCMDARAPAEMIFDVGLGDIFSIRLAGNVAPRKVLGSVEYAAGVAGSKLVVVMGHTRCGAIKATVDAFSKGLPKELDEFPNIADLVRVIKPAVEGEGPAPDSHDEAVLDRVAKRNVENTITRLLENSAGLRRLVSEGRIAVVGSVYDLKTGAADFFPAPGQSLPRA